MTRTVRRLWLLGAGLSAAALPAPAVFAQAIAPHAADYAVRLEVTAPGSPYRSGSGRLVHRWADGCTTWDVDQEFALTVTYGDGAESGLTAALASREAKDGTRLEVRFTGTTDGVADEVRAADATRLAPGGPGQARTGRIAEDGTWDPQEWDLPAGALLPTEHTLALLEAAAAGETALTARVVQGQDHRPLFEVDADIHSPIDGAWPVALLFFRVEDDRVWPLYRIEGRLRPDGVMDPIVYDYGDYRLVATLQSLTPLPRCTG